MIKHSIIIPAYQCEASLENTVKSVLESGLSQLEIIIVNDGSRDKSSAIAHEYADKYPQTYIVIDKPNGNYGSCVNAALKVATGKYFRICDADDCYEKGNLNKYLDFLVSTDVDIVFTPYSTYSGDDLVLTFDVPIEYSEGVFSIDDLNWRSANLSKFRAMHTMTVKRGILVSNNYYQTEGISYTDTQFIFYSCLYAKTCAFFNAVLYLYFLGRDGQTMSPAAMVKSHMHFYENANRILDDYLKVELDISDNRAIVLELCFLATFRFFVSAVLLDLPYQREKTKLIKDLLRRIVGSSRGFLTEQSLLSNTPYKLWRKKHIPAVVVNALYRLKCCFCK